jgi:hypothetical protein
MRSGLRIDEIVETVLCAYEEAIRRSCDLQRTLGRTLAFEPAGTIFATTADVTRDVAAVQLSAARWLLDA